MKLLATGRLYPYIIQGSMKKQLEKNLSRLSTKQILKEARKEYKQIVKRTPEIGGRYNLLIDNFYISAYIIALYKFILTKTSLEVFDEMISEGINNFSFLRKIVEKEDLTSEIYRREMREISDWCEQHKDEYPSNWLLSIEKKEQGEIHMTYYNCPLCDLCTDEGVPELMSTLCKVDYILMNFAKGNLNLMETLGKGDTCCNFVITKN